MTGKVATGAALEAMAHAQGIAMAALCVRLASTGALTYEGAGKLLAFVAGEVEAIATPPDAAAILPVIASPMRHFADALQRYADDPAGGGVSTLRLVDG